MSRGQATVVESPRFPVLISLGLGDSDLLALARQGTIIADRSGPGRGRYKLRFRVDGRQRVKYLGGDEHFIAEVQRELAALQRHTKTRLRHRQLIRGAMFCLRQTKVRIEPLLEHNGYQFHGREVRRRRERPNAGESGHELALETQYRSKIMDDFVAQTPSQFTNNDRKNRPAANPANDQLRQHLNELRLSIPTKTDPVQKLALEGVADLLQVAGTLGDAIKDEFEGHRPNLREVQEAMPTIKTWTLVHRQAFRYAKLDRDSTKPKNNVEQGSQSPSGQEAEK